jgi:hypothetical protein
MANAYTYQVLKDTNQKTVIKLTGAFDGTTGQESNNFRIQANTLYGALDANSVPLHTSLSLSNTELPYYNLQVTRINYVVNMASPGYVDLFWQGTTPSSIALLNRNGELSENQGLPSMSNNAVGANGSIGIATHGATANSSYTIILELRKDNAYYDRGQFEDPSAFNYGKYSLKP